MLFPLGHIATRATIGTERVGVDEDSDANRAAMEHPMLWPVGKALEESESDIAQYYLNELTNENHLFMPTVLAYVFDRNFPQCSECF